MSRARAVLAMPRSNRACSTLAAIVGALGLENDKASSNQDGEKESLPNPYDDTQAKRNWVGPSRDYLPIGIEVFPKTIWGGLEIVF